MQNMLSLLKHMEKNHADANRNGGNEAWMFFVCLQQHTEVDWNFSIKTTVS